MSAELDAAYRRIDQLEAALARRTELLDRRTNELDVVKSSKAYRFAHATQRLVERFFPLYSHRRTWLKRGVNLVAAPLSGAWKRRKAKDGPPPEARYELEMIPQDEYVRWMQKNEPTSQELQLQGQHRFAKNLVVSLIVPVFNPPAAFLAAMIESVKAQTYGGWELCLADASTAAHVRPILEDAKADPRIRVKFLDQNLGIAGNSNAALSLATGELIGFLDHDDTLAPQALFEIVSTALRDPQADVIYSDEDKLDRNGQRVEPLFKPDWSPETLRSRNYLCHLTVIRKAILDDIGGFRDGFDGAQDYDLFFRATEAARKIVHIPHVLYHWRAHDGSTAANHAAKSYAFDAGKKAIEDHLDRCRVEGTVRETAVRGTYHVNYKLRTQPKVSVIIPNKDHPEMLVRCVDSVLKSSYTNVEILIVENGSTRPETHAYYRELEARQAARVISWEKPFNYASVNNFAAAQATGDLFLFLNNDIESIESNWLDAMVRQAVQPGVGAVGAKLLYPDDTIQHAGIVIGMGGVAGHRYVNFPRHAGGYHQRLRFTQNMSACTAACLLVPRYAFEKVGGFDEGFVLAFNDVDFCLQLLGAGYRVVWTPDAELYHLESKTRGAEDTVEKQRRFKREYDLFLAKWAAFLQSGDPYDSPHFRLDRVDVALKAA
ncbi:MAG: glycosyltransferase family 2 protein [Gemmataceae bacterium]